MTSLVRNPGHILVLSSLRFLQIDRLNSTRRRSSFLLDVVSALKIYFLHLQLISQMRNMLPGECVLSAKPVTEHWACEDTLSEFNLDSIFQRKRKWAELKTTTIEQLKASLLSLTLDRQNWNWPGGLRSKCPESHVSWWWVFCMTVCWNLRKKAAFQQGYNRKVETCYSCKRGKGKII